MGVRTLLEALAIAAAVHAAPAAAAPIAAGTLILDLRFVGPVAFPAASLSGDTGDGSAVQLASGGGFAGTETRNLGLAGIVDVRFQVGSHAGGTFSGTPLAGSAPFVLDLVLVGSGGITFATLPIPIGASFTTTVPAGYTGFFTSIVASGRRWTAGVASLVGLSPYTGFVTQEQRTGTNQLGPGGVGSLQLVAPVRISSSLGTFPLWGTLELVAVPEPTTALLLAWGAVCLGAAGWRRRGAR